MFGVRLMKEEVCVGGVELLLFQCFPFWGVATFRGTSKLMQSLYFKKKFFSNFFSKFYPCPAFGGKSDPPWLATKHNKLLAVPPLLLFAFLFFFSFDCFSIYTHSCGDTPDFFYLVTSALAFIQVFIHAGVFPSFE